jgi:hypothetical protein
MLDTGCSIFDGEWCKVIDGIWILDAGYSMLDTGFRVFDA